MKVTFFGHRDTPPSVLPKLRKVIISLVEQQGKHVINLAEQ